MQGEFSDRLLGFHRTLAFIEEFSGGETVGRRPPGRAKAHPVLTAEH